MSGSTTTLRTQLHPLDGRQSHYSASFENHLASMPISQPDVFISSLRNKTLAHFVRSLDRRQLPIRYFWFVSDVGEGLPLSRRMAVVP